MGAFGTFRRFLALFRRLCGRGAADERARDRFEVEESANAEPTSQTSLKIVVMGNLRKSALKANPRARARAFAGSRVRGKIVIHKQKSLEFKFSRHFC